MVSGPSSGHLGKFSATKKDDIASRAKRAIFEAVTSLEDRLGEGFRHLRRIFVANSEFETSVNINAMTTGSVWRLGVCSITVI